MKGNYLTVSLSVLAMFVISSYLFITNTRPNNIDIFQTNHNKLDAQSITETDVNSKQNHYKFLVDAKVSHTGYVLEAFDDKELRKLLSELNKAPPHERAELILRLWYYSSGDTEKINLILPILKTEIEYSNKLASQAAMKATIDLENFLNQKVSDEQLVIESILKPSEITHNTDEDVFKHSLNSRKLSPSQLDELYNYALYAREESLKDLAFLHLTNHSTELAIKVARNRLFISINPNIRVKAMEALRSMIDDTYNEQIAEVVTLFIGDYDKVISQYAQLTLNQLQDIKDDSNN